MASKRILVASLDWGLGHTTRSIPVMRHLLRQGHHVIFAGNKVQRLLVRAACDGVDETELAGYGVTYSRRALMAGLVAQLPKIVRSIRKEHRWLAEFLRIQPVHGVISDNRYGFHHPGLPSAILTHQLNIRTGMGRLADAVVRTRHDRMLNRFGQTWIVDDAATNLAGGLCRRESLPPQARFFGLLSQCANRPQTPTLSSGNRHVLVLLSGPEPQRTMLSDLLWEQATRLNEPIVFVEGNRDAMRTALPHIRHIPMAEREAVPELMAGARLVICRSGYSTLMDLAALHAPAVLIPTPGQTEQEYLAKHAASQGWALTAQQQGFELSRMMDEAATFDFRPMARPEAFTRYHAVLDSWVATL